MAEVVEIRVHGVGGAPAGDVLDDPHPRLVAGDRVSGFWESKDPRPAPAGYSRRALAWGGTTSGSWQQALWVTLLPFALVNVGGWMHPPGKRPSRLVRVFGATLTLSTVLLAAVTAYDVVAIQCGSERACVAGHAWLAPLTWQWGGDNPVFLGRPAPRLALLTVLPAGLLVLLWFAGRYAYRRLEGYYPLGREAVGGDGISLSHADFWRGAEPAYRTRMLHLAAARALIAATLSWSLVAVLSGRAEGWALGVFGASALLVVAACGWVAWPGLYFRGPNRKLKPWLAGLSGATWLVLGAALGIGASVPLSGPGRVLVAALALGAGVGAVVLAARPTTVGPAVLAVAALSLGLLAGVLTGDPGGGTEPQPHELGAARTMFAGLFPAPYQLVWALAAVQTALLAAIFVAASTSRRLRDDRGERDDGTPAGSAGGRTPFGGRGPFVACLLALFLVVAVGGGVHRLAAQAVGDPVNRWDRAQPAPVQQRSDGQPAIGFPWWYETTAHVLLFVLVVGGLRGLSIWRGLRRDISDADRREVRTHLALNPAVPNAVDETAPGARERLDEVVSHWRLSGALLHADRALASTVYAATVLALLLVTAQAPVRAVDAPWWTGAHGWWWLSWTGRSLGPLATFALWLMGLLPVLGVGLLRMLARNEPARRQIGRVWDVVTFWPRHVHPFAPPAYAERVVPQLRLHVEALLARGHGVVLVAHSQGSVIAAAATALPAMTPSPHAGADPGADPGQAALTALVTCGSPLGILYERVFPAYFGPSFFATVDGHVATWHNVYARTDVFAYPLWDPSLRADPSRPCRVCVYRPPGSPATPVSDHGDYVIVDPERWASPTGEPPAPAIRGHGAYYTNTHEDFELHLRTIALALAGVGRSR